MHLKLTLTLREKLEGKSCNVYRLYEGDILLGESIDAGRRKFIRYEGKTVDIQDQAPWYLPADIRFVDTAADSELGHFPSQPYGYDQSYLRFICQEEEWILRKMTMKEINDRKYATEWWGGLMANASDGKWISCAFGHPPPQTALFGTHIDKVATIETNGNYILPIMLSLYVKEKWDLHRDSN